MFAVNVELCQFCARDAEFITVCWLSRFRCCCKILLSLLAVLNEGAFMLLNTGLIGSLWCGWFRVSYI